MKRTERSALDVLRAFVDQHDSQRAAARALGISEPYLSDLLKGRRFVTSERMLTALGLESVVREKARA